MQLSVFFEKFFGGKPRVDLWRRFERMRESVTGTMSHFYKVREIKTGTVLGLKIIDHAKSDRKVICSSHVDQALIKSVALQI